MNNRLNIELNTFSIVARCETSGMLGVAVSTAVPGVGGICPYVRARVGAVSTQSWVNPYLAIDLLDALADGASAPVALERLVAADEAEALRQIAAIGNEGPPAVWTGAQCTPWCGHLTGSSYSVQGNMLVGEVVLKEMAEAFESAAASSLDERLLCALEAGQAAGGDKRGKQSAALQVHNREAYAAVDLRVDEHANPVAELRRVYTIASAQLFPFVDGMPTRAQPSLAPPAAVSDWLLLPPPKRPGGGGSGPD